VVRPVDAPTPSTGAYERTAANDEPPTPNPESRIPADEIPTPESEFMIARGESAPPRPTEEPATPAEPRIEKYRER
jgi:hypothetical protein